MGERFSQVAAEQTAIKSDPLALRPLLAVIQLVGLGLRNLAVKTLNEISSVTN